jgi:hypothetical protein
MLTVPQTDIVSLLSDFKCLRCSHVRKYIAAKHKSSDAHLDKMLRQLSFMGRIKLEDDYISLPGRKMDSGVIKAFDVMTELTGGHASMIYPGSTPFALMFSAKPSAGASEYSNFGVIIAEPYHEKIICARLRTIDRGLTVIFILSRIEQRELISINNVHYFALQDENGKYKFFKAAKVS